MENNFSLFSDVTIKNGINKLRGQGVHSGWPAPAGKLLFNKSQYFITGGMNWFSTLQPSIYFGEFDRSGRWGWLGSGAFPKVLIIPFILGLFFVITKGEGRHKKILPLFFLLSWPATFLYPQFGFSLVILILPFIVLITSWGIVMLGKKARFLIVVLVLIETIVTVAFSGQLETVSLKSRPVWLKEVMVDIKEASNSFSWVVSDDLTDDVAPYLNWYLTTNPKNNFLEVGWPYRVRQTSLNNIIISGSGGTFTSCPSGNFVNILASKRDLKKINEASKSPVNKIYFNEQGKEMGYLLQSNACYYDK
ncbi:hypothetical protein C4577_00900 [Candidatus Parcubacteria bacterium]|nr:MAG: hypothetical protein C4577_00900 [Candidatus Parcubacteria bacterium]